MERVEPKLQIAEPRPKEYYRSLNLNQGTSIAQLYFQNAIDPFELE